MTQINRREALVGAAGVLAAAAGSSGSALQKTPGGPGRLKQSVCRWCYAKIPLPELCKAVADMGLTAMDLLTEKEWPVAREYGLTCSMGSGAGGTIADGLNVKANHDKIVAGLERAIPIAAAQKVPNLITFFGNRRGMSDEEAIANSIECLNRIKKPAEDHGVTICVELLNSKVNHPDYQGDKSAFGVAVVKAVNSPRVKLLYDIYHMQIMEGDIIATIGRHHACFKHYHTAGVPGRHEIGDQQELNYPAICRAIRDTGFDGYLAQEFMPAAPDPVGSLREAIRLCDV